MAMTPSLPPGAPKKGQAMSKEVLWQEFLSDPSQWWNNRFDKKSPRLPDSRPERTKEGLWIEGWWNPPWVKGELFAMVQEQPQPGHGFKVHVHYGAPVREDNGTAELNQGQLFNSDTSTTMTTAFDRGSREGVNKNYSGIWGDVRILCKGGQLKEALRVLNQQGISADSNTYIGLLQECSKIKDLAAGKHVHAHIIQNGFKPNVTVLNTLLNMYAKCGTMVDARQVFDKMPERDVCTWTIMMAGYAKHGKEAFEIYEQMIRESVMPNRVTFICALNVCANLGALEKGKEVHAHIIKAGAASYLNLENTLVNMYAKCGSVKDARQVFDSMAVRNVVSWNVMIVGYAQHGCGWEAFEIYEQMIQEGVTPNKVTFICILNACASLGALEKGKEVHADIRKAGIASHVMLDTALAVMYSKCGSMKDARQVFDNMAHRDVVSWSAMVTGYAQHGCDREAFEMYRKMQGEGMIPDKVMFICVLNACASLEAFERGKEVHMDIIKAGIMPDIFLETALLEMYAKCGNMKNARQVFDNMAQKDVVSWNAMMTGYAQHGCGSEALKMYKQMIQEGVTPNQVTFICLLNACASLAALERGKEAHADIMKSGIPASINLENTLINMYAKCGSLKDARQVFDKLVQRNVVSWNAIIAGCTQHGRGQDALQLYEQMQQEGLKPDGITFLCLISACSHVGLVEEGCHYFDSMIQDHGLTPAVEHLGCMVDLLGRGGRLDEAEDFISKMPIEPDVSVWGAFLGACRIHGDLERAERVAKLRLKSDPQYAATYVLLSNIYGSAGRWDDKAKVRKMMDNRGVRKEPDPSCIEVDAFLVEDN